MQARDGASRMSLAGEGRPCPLHPFQADFKFRAKTRDCHHRHELSTLPAFPIVVQAVAGSNPVVHPLPTRTRALIVLFQSPWGVFGV
jgi:hypothetical protein